MKPEQSFPNQTYTSIETAELERLRARVVELEPLRKQFEDYVRRSEEDSESLRAQLAEARTVVVPEITDERLREMIVNAARRCGSIDFDPEDVSDGDLEILHEIRDDLASLFRAIPADRVLVDGQERIRAESESPTEKGWYECWAVDGRWGVRMQYRAWGNGCWWTPLADGWVSSKDGVYKWRGPVADIGGPAPDGTNPGSIRANQGGTAT